MQELRNESTLFETLAFHRMKFLQLLNEGASNEDLILCQSAIQFYLSEISSSREAARVQAKANRKADKHQGVAVFFRSLFHKTPTVAKAH